MDVNVLSSAYEKDVTGLVQEAIAQENSGVPAIYYAKKEATSLPGAGVQFPKRLQDKIASSGIIRRFSEKVNMNIQDSTQSLQFKEWFGDWRAYDKTPIQVADRKGAARGVQQNADTGWEIQISGKVFAETKTHRSVASQNAVPHLDNLEDIVRKAVLLDSSTMGGKV